MNGILGEKNTEMLRCDSYNSNKLLLAINGLALKAL
jgi:hypothetical protein